MFVTSGTQTPADMQFAVSLGGAAEARWLIHRARGAAVGGKIGTIAVEPGGEISLRARPEEEQALFVLEGNGSATIGGASTPIASGDTIFAAGGGLTEIRAADGPLQILLIHRGSAAVATFNADDRPQATESAAATGRQVRLNEVPSVPFHKPKLGFLHVAARWLVNSETVNARGLIVGQSTFVLGGAHLLHRHHQVEEFFFILEGRGVHLVEGGEIPMAPGDIAFVARSEWHGFRNTGVAPVRAVFGYFGESVLATAGYEVHPAVAALARTVAAPR